MEPDCRTDFRLWGNSLLRCGDYSKYLFGRYVWTSATSTWALHLGSDSFGDPLTPATGYYLVIQTSHGEGQLAKGPAEYEGSGATGSSDGTNHLPATSFPQSRPAIPHQQIVLSPVRTPGPRVSFDSATKPASTGSQDTDAHRRLASRGRDDNR